METISKPAPCQEDASLEKVNQLQQELTSLSLGTALRLKRGYFSSYQQWPNSFNSSHKSDLLSVSTESPCNNFSDANGEESDHCNVCSECDHVEVHMCRNVDKCTQENSCEVLYTKPFNSVSRARKIGGDDVLSEKSTANVPERRIHKSPEDILTQSFSFNESNKPVNKTGGHGALMNPELQCEKYCSMSVPQQSQQQLKQSDQECDYQKGNNFHYEAYSDPKPASKIRKPYNLESFQQEYKTKSCHHANTELRYNATYSDSRQPDSIDAMLKSSQPMIPKNKVQDILQVTDDITSNQWLNLNHSRAEPLMHFNANVCPRDDKSKLATFSTESYKNTEKVKRSNSKDSSDDNIAENIFFSGKHLAVLTYILSVAVLVLAFSVMHLHLKLESLEESRVRDVFNTDRQCGQKQPAFLDKQVLESNTKETTKKLAALFSTATFVPVNTKQKSDERPDGSRDNSDKFMQPPKVDRLSNQHAKVWKQFNEPHSSRRIRINMSSSTNKTETVSDSATTLGNSFRQEVTQVSDVLMSTGALSVEDSDIGLHQWLLSRAVRSAPVKQKGGLNQREHNKLRKDFCKGVIKCSRQRIDSFEGNFHRVIPYGQKLVENGCATHDQWEPDIVACRGNLVHFPKQYSILPFYLATNATAEKKEKKRLVVTDDKGRFHIQKHGHYLIHVNIMIKDPNGTHYLAVYLNNETVLACPDGGFPCPQTNEPSSVKYRICNIIGLIEFHVNDTVDIRTMEPNMQVRLDKKKMSHFNFALL